MAAGRAAMEWTRAILRTPAAGNLHTTPPAELRSRGVTALGGVDGRLSAPGEAEFVQQRRHVVLDGLLRQVELGADLPVGQPVGDAVEDAAFLRAQRRVPRVLRLAAAAQAL